MISRGCWTVSMVVAFVVFSWQLTWGLTWEFENPDELQGWRRGRDPFVRGGGYDSGFWVEDGVVVFPVVEEHSGTSLCSPPLQYSTELFDRARIRLRVDRGTPQGWIAIHCRTSAVPRTQMPEWLTPLELPGAYIEEVVWTSEWREYEFTGFAEATMWEGTLLEFVLVFYFNTLVHPAPDTLYVDWITLTGAGEELLGEVLPPPYQMPVVEALDPYVKMWKGVERIIPIDVDGDGREELLLCSKEEGEHHLRTVRYVDGVFEQVHHQISSVSIGGLPGDIDEDGDMDLVDFREEDEGDSVIVWLNQDGAFEQGVSIALRAIPMVFGDLDEDGHPDVVVGSFRGVGGELEEYTLTVLFGDGTGAFNRLTSYPVEESPWEAIIRDLDGDRHADVAVACLGPYEYPPVDDRVLILFNDGIGGLDRRMGVRVGDRPARIVADDFDGDGWPDLAVMNTGRDLRLAVLRNLEGNGFADAVYYPLGRVKALTSLDLDGDGDVDLVVANWSEVSLSLLINQGDGTFERRDMPVSAGPRSLVVADVDGDGDEDILVPTRSYDGMPEVNLFYNRTLERTTWVEERADAVVPVRCVLYACYPNPFNATTLIPFDLAFSGRVTLTLYDVLGRKVHTLVEGTMSPGHYTISWDGRDDLGHPVASGQYLVRLQIGTFSESKTMTLVK